MMNNFTEIDDNFIIKLIELKKTLIDLEDLEFNPEN